MLLYLSTRKMTILVEYNEDGKIISTPPIAKKFIGQSIFNLVGWMRKQGGLIYTTISQR
jgi:hypothetical protein